MFRGNGYRSRGGGGSYRGRGSSGRSGNQSTRMLKGLFADGVWHCECSPRLPAEHFKVKKEGKNQGRWFYTCQQQEPKRCGFFLWDEDAKPREEAAVLSNSRTEPMARNSGGGEVQEGWSAGRAQQQQQQGAPAPVVSGKGLFAGTAGQRVRDDDETDSPSPPPPYSSSEKAPASSNGTKRSANVAGLDEDEDEFFPWPLTGQEERELTQAADNAAPETPFKAQKTGVYATPATTAKRRLPWLEQQQPTTPTTATASRPAESYFDTPSKRPAPANQPAQPTTPTAPPTLATARSPSPPTRHKDALRNPADSSSSLTTEALATLAGASIPPDILSNLRSVLSKHDLRTQGVTKGRDISRLALKAKDAKIAELQAKIASLEAEREMDRGVMRQLKWERESGQRVEEGT